MYARATVTKNIKRVSPMGYHKASKQGCTDMLKKIRALYDSGAFLIALYVGISLFLLWRGRGSLYFYSTRLGLPTAMRYPLEDAIREGAIVGIVASALVYCSTLWSVRKRGSHSMLTSLANLLIFFGVGGVLWYLRPDTAEAVVLGVFIASGAIASVSTAWYLFLRFERTRPSDEGLKLRHAKYLEFVHLLSWTAIVLITGGWVVTWAYWWESQEPRVRASPDWTALLADQASMLFFILAGFFFGVMYQFIRELGRIEEVIGKSETR